MADDEDKENKTEEPTHKRLEEAYKKGNVPFSKEIGSFFALMLLTFVIAGLMPTMMQRSAAMLTPFLSDVDTMPADQKGVGLALYHLAWSGIGIIALPLFGSVIAALAAGFMQNGIMISAESIKPKLEKLSVIKGISRMFSKRSIVEFLKSLVKISIVGIIAFLSLQPELPKLQMLPNDTIQAELILLSKLASHVMIGICIAMFFIALFDLVYQRVQHRKQLRMSKQEIKDEYKQSEGDPVIKQRLRQLRQQRASNRMMAAVPESDVVITNPTHFAVALKYEQGIMKAPTVTAKGQDLIALKIREIAEENDVPIVENPPLARALFQTTDIEDEIPLEHYEAVAKIITYVYQLKGKKFGA